MDDDTCAYCSRPLEDGYCSARKQTNERPPSVDNGSLYSHSDIWAVVEPYEFTSIYAAVSMSEVGIHLAVIPPALAPELA